MLNIRKFLTGINLIPNSGSVVTTSGDLAYNNSTSQVELYTSAVEQITTNSNTQILTNKSISGSTNTLTNIPVNSATGILSVLNGGTGTTTSTGTGSVVLSNSPALVTPALGTPSAAVLTNATGLPLTTGVTGTLPIANGGTNATTQQTALNNIAPGSALAGQAITYNGTNWIASTIQSGAKNYITYNNFENNATTGYSLGTIGTLTNGLPTGTPTFGSGASGNLSISTVSSGQLAGSYSLSYASSAATTQGNMLATQAYTIDAEDQAKVLTIKFYYSVPSGASNCNFSGTSSNSFAWAVYDVTNSSWLSSAGNFNLVQTTGAGYVTGTCQTNATTSQIRLVIYNANATSGAATLYLDDFYVGPQTAPSGPAMTDFQAYTPTFTGFGTPSGVAFFYRRVGDSVEIYGDFNPGTTTAVQAQITLPSGLVADPVKLPSQYVVGNAILNAAGGAAFYTLVTGGNNYIQIGEQSGGSAASTPINGNAITTTGWSVYAKVPISGWSSNSSQSSDTDTRVCTARVGGALGTTPSGSAITFPTVSYDTHGAYSTSTGQFKVPISGYYDIFGFIGAGASADFFVYKNGTSYAQLGTTESGSSATLSGSVQCIAGDLLDIRPDASVTPTSACAVTFKRASGPAVVAATESVNARYTTTAGGTINNSPTAVTFGTKSYDTHNAFSGSTYTAPISGKYSVKTSMRATLSGYSVYVWLYKNGTEYSALYQNYLTTTSNYTFGGSDDIQLNAGDTIQIYAQISTATALSTTAGDNYVSIARLGN